MDINDLRAPLSALHPLTDEAWRQLSPLFEPMSLARQEFLIAEGEHASHCYMLLDGVVRVFYNKDGSEYNKTFFVPGMFPTPLTALLTGEPCQLNFQALTPCTLMKFAYQPFRDLFERHRCLESLMLRVLEIQWMKKEKHDIEMVINDATTNYQIFREEHPGLENLIPQYHIASYLGITPIQLSRIRAQMAQG